MDEDIDLKFFRSVQNPKVHLCTNFIEKRNCRALLFLFYLFCSSLVHRHSRRGAGEAAGGPGRSAGGAGAALSPPGHGEHGQPPGRGHCTRESRHRGRRCPGPGGEDEQGCPPDHKLII